MLTFEGYFLPISLMVLISNWWFVSAIGFIFISTVWVKHPKESQPPILASSTVQSSDQSTESPIFSQQLYFANLSHEIRTPVSLIIPTLQQVLKKENISEDTRKLIAMAERNSQRLLRVANQFLSYQKISLKEYPELQISRFHLSDLIKQCYESFTNCAARKKINFQMTLSNSPSSIESDYEKLETILYNFLSNAFKFTPVGGRILLSVDLPDGDSSTCHGISISVTDSGPGIDTEEIGKIFLPYYQGKAASTSGQGTGIGLALVNEYANVLGYSLSVDSKSGEGSRFSIFLPIASQQ